MIFSFIGGLILYLLYQNQNASYLEECALKGIPESECSLIDKIIADFKTVKLIWIFIVLILFTFSNYLRAKRWEALLEVMGYSSRTFNTFGSVMLGYFANLGIPRLGEFIRPATLSKYEDIPFEKNIGTIIVERIIDVICLLICMGLAVILAGKTFIDYVISNSEVTRNQILVFLGVALLGFFMAIYVYKKIMQSDSENKMITFVQEKSKGLIDGILTVLKVKNKGLYIVQTIGIWFCYFLMTYLCFFAYEPVSHLGPVAGLVAFVFGSLGIVFPSPGGMGSYHFLISQALILYAVPGIEAFTFANILFFAIQIFCNILLGVLSLILLPILNR